MPTRTDRFDLRALLETSRLLASSLDVDFVLGSLLLTAMSKLFVTRGLVLLDDPMRALEGGGFRVEAVKGRFPEGSMVERGTLIRFRCPESLVEGEEMPRALVELGVELLAPITYHERRIGVLALGPKATGGAFTSDERAFLDALVNMSATAVHNAWVVEELKQANQELGQKVQQLNTLFDLAQGFTAAPDVDKSAHLLTLTLMGQFMVRRFAVLLREEEAADELQLAVSRDHQGLDDDARKLLAGLSRLMVLDDDESELAFSLREAGFALALPLRMQNVTRGVLLIGPKGSGTPYDVDEVEFLSALGQLALTAIENARGVAARIDKERLEDELRLARTIQERLLPQKVPAIAGAEVAAVNLASRVVAGDYYDAIKMDEDRVLLAIADVSGKGLPASLLMANLQACLHVLAASLTAGTIDLPTATGRVNRVIHQNTSVTTFITFFWGIYNRQSGALDYVNAGHNPPVVIRANGSKELLEEGGLLLGVLADAPYQAGRCILEPDDFVTLYTDGITEAWSAKDRDDEFGEERLERLLLASRGKSATDVLRSLRAALADHTGGAPLDDDLTVLVLRRVAEPGA